ncbi:hypothetical protein [Pseudonocardia humida]|uniref:Uncharacterized protein n=1 Tax=Pseudonocardia humida TaxID=2800819 RepID=A0ABT1A4H2_9PSEU|nr:hypothetical protein [Pseudonocardia humida]MCO1657846.1 hypothetical protein [Pseudonocardia humida]
MGWFRRRLRGFSSPRSPRAPRPRGRFGFWGPLPTYRTRTRRGSEVSVSGCGCCLPIPLIALAGTAAGLRTVWRWARG